MVGDAHAAHTIHKIKLRVEFRVNPTHFEVERVTCNPWVREAYV